MKCVITSPEDDTRSHPHIPIERRPRNPPRLADVVNVERLVGIELVGEYDLGLCRSDRRTPPMAPTGSGSRQACLRSLLDQPPLELSQRREDVEDQLA